MDRLCALALLVCLCAAPTPASAAAAPRVAIFDFELIDTSLEGEILGAKPAEQARLGRLTERLRGWFAGDGRYEVADIAPVAARAKASNLEACGGCVAKFSHSLGATLAVNGTVQKVSNLILNINLYVTDVETGKPIAAMSTDIRSNTDDSWQRGLDWLIEHRLPGALDAIPR